MNKSITIITTTYNRADELRNLYISLTKQTDKDFEWLVINDGSSDNNVEEEILDWKKNKNIDITYVRQNNLGKMVAYQRAINLLKSDYSIVVDSDDWLSPQAVMIMKKYIPLSNIGIVFPRYYHNSKEKIKKWKDVDTKAINIINLKYEYGIEETALLINNLILKKAIKHIIFNDEKFMSEEILYNKLSEYGKFTVKTDVFYNSSYQDDGLTKNLFKIWIDNPMNTICLLKSRYKAINKLNYKKKLIVKIKTILNYDSFCLAKRRKILKDSPNIFLSIFLLPIAFIVKKKRFE